MQTPTTCQSTTDTTAVSVPPKGKSLWRSVAEFERTPEFAEMVSREFPEGADSVGPEERRQFIRVMGASFALAGLAITGCRRWPEQKIAPYASRPATRMPGQAVRYATCVEIDGVGTPLLAKSVDGRPIKVDGNGGVPGAVGGTSAGVQSTILDLYDPDRSRQVLQFGHQSSVPQFQEFASGECGRLRTAQGAGLAFLLEPTSSPTRLAMRQAIRKAYPKAAFHEWTPRHNDSERAGTAAAFGSAKRPVLDLSSAKVVVAFDADFLMDGADAPRTTAGWASTRRVNGENAAHQELSRLYSFESRLSVTGMNADERVAVRSGEIASVVAEFAKRLGVDGGDLHVRSALAKAGGSVAASGRAADVLAAAVKDVHAAKGRCVVVAGPTQPAGVHALVALLNERIGASGRTVHYAPVAGPSSLVESITGLAVALNSGTVETLVICGANPAYDAPPELGFADALAKAKTVIRLADRLEETGSLKACSWSIPAAHFLECWGDSVTTDGTIILQQPLILPLIEPNAGGLSEIELLWILTDAKAEQRSGDDIVREVHAARTGQSGSAFETSWRAALESGSFGTAFKAAAPTVNAGAVASMLLALSAPADGAELVLFTDSKVLAGRWSNNAWMQELPDAVTKVTWDNTLILSPATAKGLGVKNGSVIRVTVDGRSVDAAVFVLPGQADGSVALALGYGRGAVAGRIADGAGCDAFQVWSGGAGIHAASLQPTGETYPIANTQDKGISEAIMPEVPLQGIQDRLPTLVREGTLEEYRLHPDFAKHRVHVVHRLSLWEESNLDGAQFRWAMSVDLNTCTGCSACVTACQSENNIPVVGKAMVLRGREMSWIRLDRYFKGSNPSNPVDYRIQPVACQHCENAPCEQVCPVGATLHDKDGLNVMVYNRCIGTRYCSNNCPYKVRRFNFFDFNARTPDRVEGFMKTDLGYYERYYTLNRDEGPDLFRQMQFNPDVTVRSRGVMEKCTFCTQRIQEAKIDSKNRWAQKGGDKSGTSNFSIPDGTIVTACQQACPAGAIVFGDLNDPNSQVSQLFKQGRSYQMLEELNTKTRLRYLAKVTNPALPREDDPHSGHDHSGHDHEAHA
ncbi:MAG: TAT-variant-translocated molybdopterin oxidoreductase [Planctomycetota bacterium]|nr:TAT-variant-translocated molybdopterin oxidoreductase [Planctomycetota bacterium]MDA1105676.1 TAT-variant-translocated molybdopterin oxidoreductase [Planctomycetota bacterium]